MVQKDFNTDDDDCDGYITNGHLCGFGVNNTGILMECGVDDLKCITDGKSNRMHSDCSFNTSTIPNDATITAVALFFYVSTIEKTRGLVWSAIYDAKLEITTAKNQIGAALDQTDYDYGTIRYNSNAFKTWATGWKEINLGTSSVYVDGDTDVEIRPNDDWYTDLDSQGKKFILHITTNEGGANKPYLRVTYTVKGKTFTTILGAS